MTRKDYIAIANVIKEYKGLMADSDHHQLVWELADIFQNDNERFDQHRFMAACGHGPETIEQAIDRVFVPTDLNDVLMGRV